jgi:hypothetical protein
MKKYVYEYENYVEVNFKFTFDGHEVLHVRKTSYRYNDRPTYWMKVTIGETYYSSKITYIDRLFRKYHLPWAIWMDNNTGAVTIVKKQKSSYDLDYEFTSTSMILVWE